MVILTVVMFFPLFSLRNGQASTLRSLTEASIICSSLDVERERSHWNEAVRAGASAFVRLATNTTSGSVTLAFTVIFGLAESSEETIIGTRKVIVKSILLLENMLSSYAKLFLISCFNGYGKVNNINK